MEDNFKTIILRFRDLVTAESKTISLHKKKILNKDYAWWGWWAKKGEKIPIKTFSKINTTTYNDGYLKIYLFDTGRSKFYEAKCTKINYSDTGKKIKTPSESHTPKYYSDTKYLAWFKMTGIIEIKNKIAETLNSHSYIEIAEFYEDEQKRFKPFEGKIISSLEELRHQERTIWFIRDSNHTDSTHEIILHDEQEGKPEHFLIKVIPSKKESILWLSDLHFGKHHGFPLTKKSDNKKPLWVLIIDALEELNQNIAGLIISGDLTTHASDQGFVDAETLINNICSKYRLKNYDTIICPGNHDFVMEKTKSENPTARNGNNESKASSIKKINTEAYSNFYNTLFYLNPNEYYCSGRRFLLSNKYPLEIISVNSNYLQQVKNVFQGMGFVSKDQLDYCALQYNLKSTKEYPTRILVMHHHLTPVTYTESTELETKHSLSLDAESIIRWCLKYNFKVVIHGHKHKPHMVKINRSKTLNDNVLKDLYICGLGSSGCDISNLNEEFPQNTFGLLTFEDDTLHNQIYEINKTGSFNSTPLFERKICL